MSDKVLFAANLKRLIDASPLSEQQLAKRAGISERTLTRWQQAGIAKPDRRTLEPLKKICRLLKVRLDDLWADERADRRELYAEKLKRLMEHWEQLGQPYEDVTDWIDRLHIAVAVAERFRREEPELAEVIAKVKLLETEGQLLAYVEEMVRDWGLDESAAYRRLTENTQRFLAAALPRDPDQLGRWFKDAHPARWRRLLARKRIDNDGELFAYVRHMMAEGLSSHEAYEGLIRLSN